MKPLSLILLYYDAPAMLRYQITVIERYPEDLRRLLRVILVDDGSPRPAQPFVTPAAVDAVASFRVYRTLVDVPWNEEFASNLGVAQAVTEWVLVTDLDHEVPAATLRALMTDLHDRRTAYQLSRRISRAAAAAFEDVLDVSDAAPASLAAEPVVQARTDLIPFRQHPAAWFLPRALYDEAGGRDERFAGYYQPSDNDFTRRLATVARLETLPVYEIFHPEGTCALPHPFGEADEARFAAIVTARGAAPPLRLQSPWARVL